MTTVVSLNPPLLEVTPGDEAVCLLEIRNDGPIVESYVFEVIGEVAHWTTVTPATISVYPGTTAQVELHLRPPRSARYVAGEVPYAVRVMATERPEDVVVPEGVVHLLPFAELTAEIMPRTSRGRFGGRHEVAVDNRGNTPVHVTVSAADQDARLRMAVRPPTLVIGPGEAGFVAVRARARRILWRGHPVTLPFQVSVAPANADPAPAGPDQQPPSTAADPAPTVLDAATVQAPLVPASAGRILAALLVLGLLLAGFWYAVLRPVVRSAAREVTQQEMAPIAQKAENADRKADTALQKAGGSPAPSPTPSVGPTATPSGAPGPGVPAGATSLARRLQVTAATGASRSDQYTVPSGRTFVLTDFFLQNPQGDEGRLDLVVDGDTVLTVALQNFRDLDYHLVSPIEVPAGRVLRIQVVCQRAGSALAGAGGGGQCRDFALLGGYLRTNAPSPAPSF